MLNYLIASMIGAFSATSLIVVAFLGYVFIIGEQITTDSGPYNGSAIEYAVKYVIPACSPFIGFSALLFLAIYALFKLSTSNSK